MPLPSSGPLSINDIRNALGSTSGSLTTLSELAGFSTPHKISDFYGYGSGVIFLASTNFVTPNPQVIIKSTDGGATWATLSGSPSPTLWQQIATTPNAQNILGVSEDGYAYYSTNGGTSFGNQLITANLYRCFLSDNGLYMFVLNSNDLYRSSNSGTTWTNILTNSTSSTYFDAGAVSGNGQIVVIYRTNSSSGYSSSQFYNGDYGTGTWEQSNPSVMSGKFVLAASMSYTGQYACCVTNTGDILINNNGFAFNAWTSIAKTHYMFSCDVSYTGQYIIGGSDNGYVFASTDYGVNFTTTNIGGYNMKVGVSPSGFFAVIGGSGTNDVYTSTNGTSWTAQTNTPNLTNAQYTCLSVS
jgi:hypothetical protein